VAMDKTETEIILDCDRLRELLPHRFPLLMLDRVRLIPAEKRALGLKNATFNEPYFQGHFPGNPILPGVLILEAMVQTGGVAIRQFLDIQTDVAFLLTLDKIKFRKPVFPGDRLMTDVTLERFRNGVAKFVATASVRDQQVCEARFTVGLSANAPERIRVTEFAPPSGIAGAPLPAAPINTINGVMNIIPHRYPFILVDAIYFQNDKHIIGLKNVTANEPFFNGHFPKYPIMPGTLLVEAIAQVGAVFILGKPQNQGRLAYFTAVELARFRRPVRPGDQLLIDVRETAVRPRVGKATGLVFVGQHLAAEARISFVLVDRPAPA
ncbi:MAG: 3-hydroxyacyl-ACP dehydratase FabZ, partial [Lentisphaerae bacterium]|nr:3-hydroxyacyl-ACP dehydratase FabZ [Lentisphaerota bacterium]